MGRVTWLFRCSRFPSFVPSFHVPRPAALLWVTALAVLLAACCGGGNVIPDPYFIETQYKTPGSWAVTTGTVTVSGSAYTLYRPANLGAGGVTHPILTWGNGTGGTSSKVADTLNHLASWGFVVIASNSGATGTGTEMLAGANYMVSENTNASSVFYQKLNTAKVGALGTSQGAGGTLNATMNSNGVIKTALTIELPDPIWWSTPVPSLTTLTASIFFIRGTADFIATESAAQNWYNQVPGAAAKAARKGTGHNEIDKTNNKLKGYITAWMMYTLQGDTAARGAFAGAAPEINDNTAWQDQAEKNLP